MKKIIYILIIFTFSCNDTKTKEKETVNINDNKDSLNNEYINLTEASIDEKMYDTYKAGIKISKNYKYDDITITNLSNLKFSKQIQFQYSNNDYYTNHKYLTAERGKIYISIIFNLKSKKSPNQLGISTFEYKEKFLPLITVYKIDDKLNKIIYQTDLDEYNMMNTLPKEITWIEDYFNFKEEGKMIMYKLVDEDLKKYKFLVSIKNIDGRKKTYGINLNGIIANKN
jgi:hypothetical protein